MAFEADLHRSCVGREVRRRAEAQRGGTALEMRAMAVEFPEVLNQPGRLHHLEGRVRMNEQGVQRMKGFVGAFGVVMTVVHFAVSYLTGGAKHN